MMATFDTSMYRQNPLKSVQDYTDQYDKAALTQQAIKTNALAFEDRQRALAESQALRNALASGIDPRTPEGQQKLMTVAPNAAGAVIKSLGDAAHVAAQTDELKSKTSKEGLDKRIKAHNFAMQTLQGVNSPEQILDWANDARKAGAFGDDPKAFTAAVSKALQMAQTPDGFKQWKDQSISTGQSIHEKMQIEQQQYATDINAEVQASNNALTNATSSANNAATNARMAEEGRLNRASHERIAEDRKKADEEGKYTQVIIDPEKGPMLADRKNGTFKPLKGPSGETLEGKNVTAAKKLEGQLAIGIEEARRLIPLATGSGAGRWVDAATSFVGKETEGDNASTQLETLAGWMTSNVPRMQGPQSDKDTLLYKQMAAQVGDRTKTRAARLKALDTLETLQKKYSGGSEEVPAGVDPADWKHMTPQEKALWQKK